ncbi:MAG: 23S rRNA (adenine(2503)-C(2))-methyltransferase RlmN, partial [bacterium]|nr:23S rRNA (adenine(2503)-C(2))-methyltransferase RlmN [bacterium]
EHLNDHYRIISTSLKKEFEAADGTRKLMLELKDGRLIESALIPVQSTPLKRRMTGCISSQAGCRFGCRFCASGLGGFKRQLTGEEIIEQVMYLKRSCGNDRLSHLVFMGVGEPFDNYKNVMKAARTINSKDGFNIAARRLTISTCGIVPGINRLAGEGLQIELSVSLHAADERTRSDLMPVNKRYSLRDLMAACRRYVKQTNRQVTFEYVMIPARNMGKRAAADLAKLLKGLNCKVNLIPYNPVKEFVIKRPGRQDIFHFRDQLMASGVKVTVRRSRGGDIGAACGQLRLAKR